MSEPLHHGLPVSGYQPQSSAAVALVNGNKEIEERVLRHLDRLAEHGGIDGRWYAIARTSIEQGFMALNLSVFKPGRIVLPEDQR